MFALLLSLSALVSSSQAAPRTKHILLLSITRMGAPPSHDVDRLRDDLERHNPDAEVIIVKHVWPGKMREKPFADNVAVLANGLRVAVQAAGHFNMIVLDLPGNSAHDAFVVENDDQSSIEDVKAEMELVLGPLRGKAARNARVLMLGDRSVVGTNEKVAGKVEGVLEFFGATHGSLFGLHAARDLAKPFSIKEDLEYGRVILATAVGLTGALLMLPGFETNMLMEVPFPAALVWLGWMSLFSGLQPSKWVVDSKALVGAGVALVTGTLVALGPGVFMAALRPESIGTFALGLGVGVPLVLGYGAIKSRWNALKGAWNGTFNEGRLFERKLGIGYDISLKNLWKNRAELFKCEAGLANAPEPEEQPPVLEPTAA